MDPAKYEYQSDFARRYVAQGRAEGQAEGREQGREQGRQQGREQGRAEGLAQGLTEGRAELITKLLDARFGPLSADTRARIAAASIAELDAIGERLLNAKTLQGALGQ